MAKKKWNVLRVFLVASVLALVFTIMGQEGAKSISHSVELFFQKNLALQVGNALGAVIFVGLPAAGITALRNYLAFRKK